MPPYLSRPGAARALGLLAAAALVLASCSPSGSKQASSAAPSENACPIAGAPAGTATFCLSTASATSPAKGQLTEQYRTTLGSDDGSETIIAYGATLGEDGSMLAVKGPSVPPEEEVPGRPLVGQITTSGFQAFTRDMKATAQFDMVSATRSGSTYAWAESAAASDESGQNSPWSLFTTSGGKASEVATQADTTQVPGVDLDTADPGPALTSSAIEWRMVSQQVGADGTVSQVEDYLASKPLAGGKATLTKGDLGLANRQADGSHVLVSEGEDGTSYQVISQQADGTQTTIFSGTKLAEQTAGGALVRNGTVMWWVLPPEEDAAGDGTADDGTADDGTGDDGTADDGTAGDGTLEDGTVPDDGSGDGITDLGTIDPGTGEEPTGDGADTQGLPAAGANAATVAYTETQPGATPPGTQAAPSADATARAAASPSASPSATTPRAVLYAYAPAAKKLFQIQTGDTFVTENWVTATKDRVTLASEDTSEYLLDMNTQDLYKVGTCSDQCSDAAVAGDLVFYTVDGAQEGAPPVAVIAKFS